MPANSQLYTSSLIRRLIIAPFIALLLAVATARAEAAELNLIPWPASVITNQDRLVIDEHTVIVTDTAFTNEASLLAQELNLTQAPSPLDNRILLTSQGADGLAPEAYQLEVTAAGVTIRAATAAGAFYGCQTLRQLIDTEGHTLQGVTITDEPRYAWRGFMLDVSRHFFDKPTVIRLLDWMAYYKLNRFHLHLTDDQGWRLEIQKYPALAQTGARGSFNDTNGPARYFTRADIREIIAHAQARHIVVIPEIDMPGHAGAATRALPQLAGGSNTFNPVIPATDDFLKNVWSDVLADFPSPWIHFGGDEVDLKGWKQNPIVAGSLRTGNSRTPLELEEKFMRQTAHYLHQQGRTPVGWDEIVAAHPEPGTLIFWWRHDKPEILEQALAAGYSVVLTPRTPCYFDYPEDASFPNAGWKLVNTTADVYEGPKIPDHISAGQQHQILGVEACLWTERVISPSYLEFMTFPRLPALAEMAWTPNPSRNLAAFNQRLKPYLEQYRHAGIHYFDASNPQGSRQESRQASDGQTALGTLQLN